MTGITFWTHTVWFILLGITTMITWVIIFYIVSNRKTVFAFYLTLCGLAFTFEMGIMPMLKAYTYYPLLIPNSPPDDSIAGNLFSQLSVTATALLLASLNLRYYWYFIFPLMYCLIEETFISLGIYEQHWYRTWMTYLFILTFFWITKSAYRICFTRLKGLLRHVYIFLGLLTLHQHTVVWVLRLTGVQLFSEGILPDKEHSLILLSSLYMFLLGVTIMLIYFTGIRWGWNIAVIILLYIGHVVAMRFDLILYRDGWFWITTSISIWAMYLFTYMLDKLYENRTKYS